MDKAPESTSRIAVVPYVTTLAACVIECSQVEICKAVVHDGSDCYLYNTITGSELLAPGQKAVGEVNREEEYGNSFYLNLLNIALQCTCSCSTLGSEDGECMDAIGDNLDEMWLSEVGDSNAWIKCEFGQVYVLQVVQVSTFSGFSRCDRLAVTTSSGRRLETTGQLDDSGDRALFYYDFGGVETSSVNINCLDLPDRESQLILHIVGIYVAKQRHA